jgi:hypothetical protein
VGPVSIGGCNWAWKEKAMYQDINLGFYFGLGCVLGHLVAKCYFSAGPGSVFMFQIFSLFRFLYWNFAVCTIMQLPISRIRYTARLS